MKTFMLLLVILCSVAFLTSCARGITTEQAANGKARCGKNYIR